MVRINHPAPTSSTTAPPIILSGRGGYNASARSLAPGDDDRRARSRTPAYARGLDHLTAEAGLQGRGGYNASARSPSPATGGRTRSVSPAPATLVPMGRGGYNASPRNGSPASSDVRARSKSPAPIGHPVPMGRGGYNAPFAQPVPMGRGGYNSPRNGSPTPAAQPVPMGRGGYNATARSRSPAATSHPTPEGRGGYNSSPRIGTLTPPDSPALSGRGGYNASPRSKSPAIPEIPLLAGRGGYNASPSRPGSSSSGTSSTEQPMRGSPELPSCGCKGIHHVSYRSSARPATSSSSDPSSLDFTGRGGYNGTPPNRSHSQSPAL